MGLFDELKESFKGEDWKLKYEELGAKYNEEVELSEKRKKRNQELLKLIEIFEEELLKYKTESDYQAFIEKIELEQKIRLPKRLKERNSKKEKTQEKKKLSIDELKQKTIEKRQQNQTQETVRNKNKGRDR
jgi:hypothetical protein